VQRVCFLLKVRRDRITEYRERHAAAVGSGDTDAVDPGLRDRVVQGWMKAEAYRLQTLQTVTDDAEGRSAGARSSFVKLWWSELDVELHETALDVLGAEAELDGPWSKGWQFALSGPIYAGTNEIQRNIAAERVLGLPRK